MSSPKHECDLGLGSESMLPIKDNAGIIYQTWRWLRKSGLVSAHHPEIYNYFRSYPTVLAERQKQLIEGGNLVIHPFSLFRLYWNSLIAFISLAHMCTSTLRLCFILEPLDQPMLNALDMALLVFHTVCMIGVIIEFNSGYVEGTSILSNVVMDRNSISCRYIRRYFIFDLMSCLPLAFFLIYFKIENTMILLVAHMMPLMRVARLFNVMVDLKSFMKIFTTSYICHRATRYAVLLLLTMHWITCLIYMPAVLDYYWFGEMQPGYCLFLNADDHDITKIDLYVRYEKAMFIAFSAFFGTSFSMFAVINSDEMIVNSLIILIASTFMIYTIVFLLKIYTTKFNSSMRYHEMMNQVEKYMRHKQFPASLKKRVRAFYNYRYQERYFREDIVLDCLSEQLRQEMTLHTCHKLINKVSLFEGLPASLVGTLLGCLKPEVYLPNDLVLRAGEFGDCMYFIAQGTVAVYSLKGAEVCHLEDGAHFGEVALLMKDRKRVATVIAIETTQVYRLDVNDFRRFIMTYKLLYERIETIASKRINETVLLDEAFRQEREKRNEQKQSENEIVNDTILT